MGITVELANPKINMIQAWVEPNDLDNLAALDFVNKVSPPSYSQPRIGSKTTEGDSILRSNLLRNLNLSGENVKVGIISDGANDWPGAQSTGELPVSGITTFGSCTIREAELANCIPASDCNEGTAIAEIIYDIAPGASIAVGAANTSLEFIARVSDLVNNFGADIIVDDLGFLDEPYFEDGPVAAEVTAIAGNVIFVSAAGNSADNHYEAGFSDSSIANTTVNLHDFGEIAGGDSDTGFPIFAQQFGLAVAFLQWNDQFGQSDNDYDLFVDVFENVGLNYLRDPDIIQGYGCQEFRIQY